MALIKGRKVVTTPRIQLGRKRPAIGKSRKPDPRMTAGPRQFPGETVLVPLFEGNGATVRRATAAEYVEEFCRLNHLINCHLPPFVKPTNGS